MNKEKFLELIQTFGTQPRHWPERYQSAMQQFLQSHPNINNEIQSDRQLDHMLAQFNTHPANYNVIQQVIEQIKINPPLYFRGIFEPFFPKLMALSFILILGICSGFYEQIHQQEEDYLYQALLDAAVDSPYIDNESIL